MSAHALFAKRRIIYAIGQAASVNKDGGEFALRLLKVKRKTTWWSTTAASGITSHLRKSHPMESLTSRLASFSQALPPTKKRPSDPKGKRALRWPHKNPAPSQVCVHLSFHVQMLTPQSSLWLASTTILHRLVPTMSPVSCAIPVWMDGRRQMILSMSICHIVDNVAGLSLPPLNKPARGIIANSMTQDLSA